MEKKYFLFIPLFFLVFSFLFPIKGGVDRCFVQTETPGSVIASDPFLPVIPPFPGRECTCYIADHDFSAAGFLDGTLLINDKNSGFKPLDNRTSGKYQTVYSIAVSEDAEYLAVISGLYPKTLSVYQRKLDNWSLIHSVSLDKDVRGKTYLAFSGSMLLYEDGSGISALSLATLNRFSLAFDGSLEDVALGPEHEYVWVLSSPESGKRLIHLFLYDGSLIASFPYEGNGRLKTFNLVEQ